MTRRHLFQMRVFHTLALSLVALAATVLGGFLFGIHMERPYLSYGNLPFPVLTPVHAGELVPMVVVRCNATPVGHSYQVTHLLRNVGSGATMLLPDAWVEVEPGCTRAISHVNAVPPATPPGTYVMAGSALVDGVFGSHKVRWQSAPFEVLPSQGELK